MEDLLKLVNILMCGKYCVYIVIEIHEDYLPASLAFRV